MKADYNVMVEMKDGVKLSVDIYLPDGEGPWPVVLNCYPYHKDALLYRSLQPVVKRFVESNYAYVVADCRGTGASEGVSVDPLDPLNGDDLYTLVEWCGAQDWSTGKVGMWGSSYGGMTSLKAATVKPPSLKAIVPVMPPSSEPSVSRGYAEHARPVRSVASPDERDEPYTPAAYRRGWKVEEDMAEPP